jgi:ribosomal protein L37AE/L43A
MQPYNPRQQVHGQMLCPMCAKNESHRMANQFPPRFAVRHAQGRLSKTASAEQRAAHFVASDQPHIVRLGHDSGDSSTIFHCPFCGSGQVIARSDGGVECEFCHASFSVQVQPQFSAFPQSIGGMPIDVPGMGPDEGMAAPQDLAPGAQPAGPDGAGGPVPPGAQGGAESQPGEEGDPQEETDEDEGDDNPFSSKSKTSYLTHTGARLDRESYMRYLALQHASDRDTVLARIKAENEKGSR